MTVVKAKPKVKGERTYEPLWKLLKQKPYKVCLKIHPALVKRVQKAVSKEKYGDLGFKELNGHADEDHFYLKFVYHIQTQILEIELLSRYGVDLNQELEQ